MIVRSPQDGAGAVRRFRATAVAILVTALAVKLALIGHIGGRVYGDVQRGVNFGYAVAEGRAAVTTHSEQSKTFVAPLLWYRVFTLGGVVAIKAANLALFIALYVVQLLLARRLVSDEAALVSAILFAFYVGTNRNVVAGEPDDMVVSLCVAAAILVWTATRRAGPAGLLIGIGFVFKFSAAIFAIGFAAFLVGERRWRDLAVAGVAAALPIALVCLVDGGQSLRGLVASTGVQSGYNSWPAVAFKLVSTGILAGTAVAVWQQWRRPTDHGRLLVPLTVAYPVYIVLMRDAHAASFVGMLWLVFAGPLLASWLLELTADPQRRRSVAAVALAAYVAAATAVTVYRLHHDTQDLYLTRTDHHEPRTPFWLMGR
jgi:hypothetical protein